MTAYAPGPIGYMRRGPDQAFTPLNLGDALYDMWDAERSDLISLSGAAVTSWLSVKNGYNAAQAVGAARPAYSATGFNNRPGLTFDGSDDELTYAGVGVFPTGANAGEIWALVRQDTAGADATSRRIAAYGGSSNNTSRHIARVPNAGVNNPNAQTGTGAATAQATPNIVFDGYHVIRGIFTATTVACELDGAGASPNAGISATGTTSTRLGVATNGSGFFGGAMSLVAITAPLATAQVAQMLAYLKARGGIA